MQWGHPSKPSFSRYPLSTYVRSAASLRASLGTKHLVNSLVHPLTRVPQQPSLAKAALPYSPLRETEAQEVKETSEET